MGQDISGGSPDGPVVEYSALYLPRARLDNPSNTLLWLTPCLMQIAVEVLENDVHPEHGDVRFTSPRWSAFRDEASRLMTMSWTKVLDAVQREGVDFAAEHLATCFIIESDLFSDLEDASYG